MVTVIPYAPIKKVAKRMGFLKGQIKIPNDFDTMGAENIIREFEAVR